MAEIRIPIDDLLPHRDRMRLVDEIIEADTRIAVTGAVVAETWPLVGEAGVSAIVIVELVAQSAGISNGLDRFRTNGPDADKKGWLVGIKEARFFRDAVPLGARIVTRAENRFAFEGYREIWGTARVGEEVIGEVVLQVVQAEADSAP